MNFGVSPTRLELVLKRTVYEKAYLFSSFGIIVHCCGSATALNALDAAKVLSHFVLLSLYKVTLSSEQNLFRERLFKEPGSKKQSHAIYIAALKGSLRTPIRIFFFPACQDLDRVNHTLDLFKESPKNASIFSTVQVLN